MRDEEIVVMIHAVRDELMRQMAQFERDKVSEPDERARAAIGNLIVQMQELQTGQAELFSRLGRVEGNQILVSQQIATLQVDMDLLEVAFDDLTARVTLCEGKIARLEAKP